MSFLIAASDRSSGRVSGPSFSGISSFCGVSSVLLAMSLTAGTELAPDSRSSRVADSLKGRLRLPKTSSGDDSFDWFPSLLALEIPTARWPAKDTGGHSPAHSRHERREPGLGSTADPRRTAQAWHLCRADHRGKIHGEEKAATVAGLEDLSAQSCRRHCVDGFVRSPDDLVSAVVWISDLAAFPPPASVAERDRAAERPLDCPSADRSVRLATGAAIYRSRSGLRLWRLS